VLGEVIGSVIMTTVPPASPARPLRPWQRLSVRLAVLFASVTLLAVVLVGLLVYEWQRREVEEAVGSQLLNIVRTASLLVDPAAHARVQRDADPGSAVYRRVQTTLATIREADVLPTPVYTLAAFDPAARTARLVVSSDPAARPGEAIGLAPEVIQPLTWTFQDGFARATPIYRDGEGTWISAFATVSTDAAGNPAAVLVIKYPVEVFLDRVVALRRGVLEASVIGALGALVLGLLFARGVTRPVTALTAAVGRVAAGDIAQSVPVRSGDELGRLTRGFNEMLEGLRQRDFIRNTFGRYVSPEVAKTLLESPEGLKLGGDKRVVTVLMSDLRGYTRFAEHGDPAAVMAVLNDYLARMTEVIIAHGGTVNEFIGDAVFAIFGAPLPHPDHVERAAAAGLAMQRALAEINAAQSARGLPRFEMGIGINTGEAVVGNIGSEQRAKYGVVGSAVNVAARVEGASVGGQVLVSAASWACIRDVAEAAPPIRVAVKGLSEPLVLHPLQALRGRWPGTLPADEESDAGEGVAVDLAGACWLIEGKTVSEETRPVRVVRVSRHRLDLRLAGALPLLANVRLRVHYPDGGGESRDLYAKVISVQPGDGAHLARVHLTSVDETDRRAIESLIGSG
jgi:class 3 adenylate cyclase